MLKRNINFCKLRGNINLDEYYLAINLKGTKKKNMPRASKEEHHTAPAKEELVVIKFALRIQI